MKEIIIPFFVYILSDSMSLKMLLAYCAGIYTATVYDCKPYVTYVESQVSQKFKLIQDSYNKHIEEQKKNTENREQSNYFKDLLKKISEQ